MKIRRRLQAAAREGTVDRLYELIQRDPKVLDRMDETPFVNTPLHIAAEVGNLEFAAEIMRLKPSFAFKPNLQGYSPIHRALHCREKDTVLRFVDINKDLVRVKGREGLTPLHIASEMGDIELLVKFLEACPDSIEDVTVRHETALHIAVKNQQYEALQVLIGWIKRNCRQGAAVLERSIMNGKDDDGNTILHISTRKGDTKVVDLLIKSKYIFMDLNAKNREQSTALDIAASDVIKKRLKKAGAQRGSSVSVDSTLADELRSNITRKIQSLIAIRRDIENMSEEHRQAYLVVAALVATALYQAAVSPAGGVYQASATDNNNTTTSQNNSTVTTTPHNAGSAVMPPFIFNWMSVVNMNAFFLSTLTIFVLTPSGFVGNQLIVTIIFLFVTYLLSMLVVSPSPGTMGAISVGYWIYIVYVFFWMFFTTMKRSRKPGGYDLKQIVLIDH